MATKNLARTAVEAGRYEHYKIERNQQKRSRRRAEREFLAKVRLDPETYDDMVDPKEVTLGKRGFQGENLNAVYRYLDSQVGRNWDTVYSEIRKRFDIRSINAYHIVMDHMVGMVQTADDPSARWYRYHVDSQGRLQLNLQLNQSKPTKNRPKPVFFDWNRFYNFLGNRRIKREDDKFYWLNLETPSEVRIGYDEEDEPIMAPVANIRAVGGGAFDAFDQRGEFLKHYDSTTGWASKKGRKLTDQEVSYLETVPKSALMPYLEEYQVPEKSFPDPTKLYRKGWRGSLVRVHHVDEELDLVTYEVKGEGRYLKTSGEKFLSLFCKCPSFIRWETNA